jgi:hypothetical protein
MKTLFALAAAFWVSVAAWPSLAITGANAPTPILSTQAVTGPPRGATATTLASTVWTDGLRSFWLEPQGHQFRLRAIDADGPIDTADHLSPLAQKAIAAAAEESSVSDPRLDRSSRVESGYEGLLSEPMDIIGLREGALLQAHTGTFFILAYASVASDGSLTFTKAPNGSVIGRYFPERPSLWTRLQRWIASLLPWVSPRLLAYDRAPTPAFDPAETTNDSFSWPIDLVLRQGGDDARRFFDFLGARAWRLDKGAVFHPTALRAPSGSQDQAAIEAIRAALERGGGEPAGAY